MFATYREFKKLLNKRIEQKPKKIQTFSGVLIAPNMRRNTTLSLYHYRDGSIINTYTTSQTRYPFTIEFAIGDRLSHTVLTSSGGTGSLYIDIAENIEVSERSVDTYNEGQIPSTIITNVSPNWEITSSFNSN